MAVDQNRIADQRVSSLGKPMKAGVPGGMLAALRRSVADRFHRLTTLDVVVGCVDLPSSTADSDVLRPPFPAHPLCRDVTDRADCEEAWRSLLADLALRPEVYRHKCRHYRFCASIPIVWHRRCLAVCRLVCPQSVGQEAFEHHVEMLDVLCENFVALQGEAWSYSLPTSAAHREPPSNDGGPAVGEGKPRLHAKVLEAVEYIEKHFTDPGISAGSIARLLDVNATYLAHLFAEQVGVRMSRYVADRRVDLAKKLLCGTTWQVKRIALESGYVSPDWFSHVFHARTGMKPCEFRRRAHERSASPAN